MEKTFAYRVRRIILSSFVLLFSLSVAHAVVVYVGTPKSVAQGESMTITWSISDGSTCEAATPDYPSNADGIRAFWQGAKSSGSQTFTVSASTAPGTYHFSCTHRDPISAGIDSVGQSTLTVTAAPATPSATWTSIPGCNIAVGASSCVTTVGWTSSNAPNVSLTDCAGGVYSSYPTGAWTGAVTVPYNSGCYQIREGAFPISINALINSSCIANSSWDGDSCECAPGSNWNAGAGACTFTGCPTGTVKNWGAGCSGTTLSKFDGEGYEITNTAPGYEGSAIYRCNMGTWGASPEAGWSCNAVAFSCTGVDPTNATICTGDASGLAANTAKTLVSSCTATKCEFTCNPGTYFSGGICVNCPPGSTCAGGSGTPTPCPPDTYCPGGNTPPGGSNPPTNCPGGQTSPAGSTNVGQCTGGNNNCTSQLMNWGGNCSGTIAATSHGNNNSVNHSGGGYTGNATYSCNNGSYTYQSGSCTVNGPGVDGVCGATHYNCTVGTVSGAGEPWPNVFTWYCESPGGGNMDSCREDLNPRCDFTHYGCIRGVSSNQVDNGGTYSWQCTSVGSTINCNEDQMSGGAYAPSCAIGNNQTSCNTTVSWNTSNYPGTYSIYVDGVLFRNLGPGSNSSESVSLDYSPSPHSVVMYYGGSVLSTVGPYAKCDIDNGVVWDGNKCVNAILDSSSCIIPVGGTSCGVSGNYFIGYGSPNFVLTDNASLFQDLWMVPSGSYNYTINSPTSVSLGLMINYRYPGQKIVTTAQVSASCEAGSAWDPLNITYDGEGNEVSRTGSGTCKTNMTGPDLVTGSITGPTVRVGAGQSYAVSFSGRNKGMTFMPSSDTVNAILQIAAQADGQGGITAEYTSGISMLVGFDDDWDGFPDRWVRMPWNSGQSLGGTFSNVQFPGFVGQTISYRVCVDKSNAADATGQVVEDDEGNNCSDPWQNVDIIAPGKDVTAGPVTPTAGIVAGVQTTFGSTISNIGTQNINGQFDNRFEIASAANGGGTVTIHAEKWSGWSFLEGATFDIATNYTFNTPGTYSIRSCADKDRWGNEYIFGETSEANNCSAWRNIVVSAGAGPDLVASAITPTTATVNSPVTLRSTIANTGTAGTGATFYNFIQIADQANGGGLIDDLMATSMSSLAVGASQTTSAINIFSSPGTYSARACADKQNRNDATGDINETDEDNNCGAWTTITVNAAGAMSGSINAVPLSCIIPLNQSSCNTSLSWATVNPVGVSAVTRNNPAGTVFTGNDDVNRSVAVSGNYPTVTYYLYNNAVELASVQVAAACIGGTIWDGTKCTATGGMTFTNSGPILSGNQATLSYSNLGAWDLCQITRRPANTNLGGQFLGSIGSGSRSSDTLVADQTYRLTCWIAAPYSEDFRETTVTVNSGTQVTGVCGTSAKNYLATDLDFTGTLCSSGSASPASPAYPATGGNSSWTCIGQNGGPNSASCIATRDVANNITGDINSTPSSCTVATGASTCNVILDWATTNPIGTSAVTRDGTAGNLYIGNNNPSQITAVPYDSDGTVIYRLYNNAQELDSTNVSISCAAGVNHWDSLGSVCADPQVGSATVINDYGIGGPGSIDFTCTNSDRYVFTNADTGIVMSSGVYLGPVSVPVFVSGNYSIVCRHGDVSSTPVVRYFHAPPPPAPTIFVDAYPKTISRGGKSTLSWEVAFPVAACSLSAKAVCANGVCNAAQVRAEEEVNTVINTESIDQEPGGVNARSIKNAINTIAPGHEATDRKALGKKTFKLTNSIDFTIDCGAGIKATSRVRVTNSGEQ